MPTEIYLVKVGMNMTEGVIDEWYVPDGGTVEKGDMLYRLETEKVNLDVDAEVSGTVRHLVAEGITMEPGDIVGYVYAAGEDIPDTLPGSSAQPPASAPEPSASGPESGASAAGAASSTPATPSTGAGGRVLSSPAARRLAGELDVDYTQLNGSGPGGRIVEADVRAAADAPQAARTARSSPIARKLARELEVDIDSVAGTGPGGRITKEDVERTARQNAQAGATAQPRRTAAAAAEDRVVPVKGMRRTIATRMHESLMSMAQLTMDMDVDMGEAVALRAKLVDAWADDDVRPGYTDLVIRAVARALEAHPQMNATFTDTEITLLGSVHVGMAVALDDGLIVPVIRDANRLSLADLCRESARLAAAARDGTLGIDDLQDGTFTVSALGMFGVDSFTPIINSPQVGILGVNRLRDDTGWDGDTPIKQKRMKLSLTWDHRALDGAPAARFLATIKELLESPYRLLS